MKKILFIAVAALVMSGCWSSSTPESSSETQSPSTQAADSSLPACTALTLSGTPAEATTMATVSLDPAQPYTFKHPASWTPTVAPGVVQFNPSTYQSVDFRNTPLIAGQSATQNIDANVAALKMLAESNITTDCLESDGTRRVEVSYKAIDGAAMKQVSYFTATEGAMRGVSYTAPESTFAALQVTVEAMRKTME